MNRVETTPAFQLGNRVKIRYSGGQRGRIVELRGPLGPGGMQIYRVRVKRWPESRYIDMREDQLVLIPPKAPKPAENANGDQGSSSANYAFYPFSVAVGDSTPAFKLGDRVEIRLSNGTRGRIVELRGSLGPKGAQIYRVRVKRSPDPHFIEVREDQLFLISPKD